MAEHKLKVGDTVWYATNDSETERLTCPDCGGTGRLRVTFHDETQVSIECRNCSVGYDPPTGFVEIYKRVPIARQHKIVGMTIDGETVEWRLSHPSTGSYYIASSDDIFATAHEAQMRADKLATENYEEEKRRILTKEKDTRTWAWNASYHRGEIKRARKSIEYHEVKLAAAVVKAKEVSNAP